MRDAFSKLFAVLASMRLTVVVVGFLLVLTILGTLEQAQTSLYEVQRRYFESMFVVHDVHGLPVPLPGVYLLLIVLFVNLICGGILRIRKDRTTWGVIVAHVGIGMLLVGSAVEYSASQKGHATIAEGTQTAEFASYYEWEIAVSEQAAGAATELVIPGQRFANLREGRRAVFTSGTLPFDLAVDAFLPNCAPAASATGIDGVALTPLDRSKEAEQDLAGAVVTIAPKDGTAPVRGLLWAGESAPLAVASGGRRFSVELAHRRWPLPFAIRLDDFRREMHPGTGMAKAFESDVTKSRHGVEQQVKISMNAPLRDSGYTLYQSGFREPSRGGGGRWWSTFSVVRNPADDVPLWSCVVMTAGLVLHFVQKLLRHVRSQKARLA